MLPVIVSTVPVGPEVGDKLAIEGTAGLLMVKVAELLGFALTVTTTDTEPLARPDGTVATMDVLLQVETEAVAVPNFTVLWPAA